MSSESSPVETCASCMAAVPARNLRLHAMACGRTSRAQPSEAPASDAEALAATDYDYALLLSAEPCPYCSLDLLASEWADHVDKCGATTQLCDSCSDFVQTRLMDRHLASNCHYPRCKQADSPSATLGDFIAVCDEPSSDDRRRRSRRKPKRSHHDWAPLAALLNDGASAARQMSQADDVQLETDEQAVCIPCEQCGDVFFLPDFQEHVAAGLCAHRQLADAMDRFAVDHVARHRRQSKVQL